MLSASRIPVVALMIALLVGGLWFSARPVMFYLLLVFESIERAGEPFGFIDSNGKVVNDLRSFNQNWYNYSTFSRFSEGLSSSSMPFFDESPGFTRHRCVYLRPDGSFVANNATYHSAGDFSEGLAVVDVKERNFLHLEPLTAHHFDGDLSFIDKTGVRKFASYGLAQNFSQGLAAVRPKDSLEWQFIDKKGATKIKGPYSDVSTFAQNRAAVCVKDKWGLIDKAGRMVLEPFYDNKIERFHEGLAAVVVPKDKRIDYLNTDGKIEFSIVRSFPPPIYFGGIEHGESILVKDIKEPNKFRLTADSNYDVSDGLVVIEKSGKFGYADISGKTIIAPRFDCCWPFVEGRARVFHRGWGKGKLGFIDRAGNEVIPCKYVEVHDFSEGYAVVATHDANHCEYIDYSGRNVFGRTFPQAKSFHEGRAFVGRPPSSL